MKNTAGFWGRTVDDYGVSIAGTGAVSASKKKDLRYFTRI